MSASSRSFLSYAIRRTFLFNIFIGQISDYQKDTYEIYTNMILKLYKNIDRIVKIELIQNNLKLLQEDEIFNFTYEVLWEDSIISFDKRYDIYYDPSTKNIKFRIISIINSIAMMIVVMGFALWILMRTLKYDLLRYNKLGLFQNDAEFDDQYGWKLVHKDVFRVPKYFEFLSAFVGIGLQLFATSILTAFLCDYSH
ncbi:hypothetical protein HZS_1723 [Henneguya salminicola]|nr:hypothetical protein HZS_1723 [Henneguya salminicola]